jgi:hypothetical protein
MVISVPAGRRCTIFVDATLLIEDPVIALCIQDADGLAALILNEDLSDPLASVCILRNGIFSEDKAP